MQIPNYSKPYIIKTTIKLAEKRNQYFARTSIDVAINQPNFPEFFITQKKHVTKTSRLIKTYRGASRAAHNVLRRAKKPHPFDPCQHLLVHCCGGLRHTMPYSRRDFGGRRGRGRIIARETAVTADTNAGINDSTKVCANAK